MVWFVEQAKDADERWNNNVCKDYVSKKQYKESRQSYIGIGKDLKYGKPNQKYADQEDKQPPQGTQKDADHTYAIIHRGFGMI